MLLRRDCSGSRAGVIVANIFDDDDDYCYPNWGHGAVYMGPRPFYPPAYAYRPAYGPAFRPAYGYAPPVNYRHSYNNVRVNNNVNVNINDSNNNYFNRFEKNQNLRTGAQSPLKGTQHAAAQNRNAAAGANRTASGNRDESWKGQSTYAGARNAPNAAKTQDAAGRAGSAGDRTSGEVRRDDERTRRSRLRGGAGDAGAGARKTGETANARTDRGDAGGAGDTGASARQAAASRDDAKPRAAPDVVPKPADRGNAFSGVKADAGGGGGGSFDRAASARGHASTAAPKHRASTGRAR